MKIAYVMASHVPSKNANSVHVMKMCQSMAKLGHDVTLFSIFVNGISESGVSDVYSYYGVDKCFNIESIKFSKQTKFTPYLFAVKAISKVIKLKPDLVYLRGVTSAFVLMLRSGIPFVLESHSPVLRSRKKLNVFMMRKLLMAKQFLRLVVITNVLKEFYLKDASFPKDKIPVVLADGADQVPDWLSVDRIRNGNGCLQIGYFGHLYKGRGIDIIIETARQMSHCDFHIVGGKEKDIEYWQKEAEDVKNLMFHGYITPGEVYKYRNSCDILLAPYQEKVYVAGGHYQESSAYMSPLKVFEYMASKKAIICSDMPVLREVLNDENAILVKADDTDIWVEAIARLEDETLRQKLSNEAYADFMERYTWDTRAELAVKGLFV